MYISWAGPCKSELKEKIGLVACLLFTFSITFNFHSDLVKLYSSKNALELIS